MQVHIALLKWKEGVDYALVEEAFGYLRQVKDRIDGIVDIYCGHNTNEQWSKGFSEVVVVLAHTTEAIEAYLVDEVHERAVKILDQITLDAIGADYSA